MSRTHTINDGGRAVEITCSGSVDCRLCMKERDRKISDYLNSIPYPSEKKMVRVKVRKKDGRIVKKLKEKIVFPEGVPEEIVNKTIQYICEVWCDYEEAPCYRCIKSRCVDWQKSSEYKGRDPGCPHQIMTVYCGSYVCVKGLLDPLEIR